MTPSFSRLHQLERSLSTGSGCKEVVGVRGRGEEKDIGMLTNMGALGREYDLLSSV